jgi:hypothetical protein
MGTWSYPATSGTGRVPAGSGGSSAVRSIADLTWEAPDELTVRHAQAFQAAMRAYHVGDSERADQQWENFQAIWSQAWSANCVMLELCRAWARPGSRRSSPALGGRLVRAPHQPLRPAPSPRPQRRLHQFDRSGKRLLTVTRNSP